LAFGWQILETQQALVAAKAEDMARGGASAGADVRRWTGLRNLVEARALLKTLFRSAAQLRAQVGPFRKLEFPPHFEVLKLCLCSLLS
jgi:hypothetical protein